MIAFDDPNLIPASFEKPDPVPDETVMLLVYATFATGSFEPEDMDEDEYIDEYEDVDEDEDIDEDEGSGWRYVLESASPLLYSRLVEAASVEYRRVVEVTQQRGVSENEIERQSLEDQLEYNPQFSQVLKDVTLLADQLVRAELGIGANAPIRINFCHRVWNAKKKILREQHGIEWFSLAQMNPFRRYC